MVINAAPFTSSVKNAPERLGPRRSNEVVGAGERWFHPEIDDRIGVQAAVSVRELPPLDEAVTGRWPIRLRQQAAAIRKRAPLAVCDVDRGGLQVQANDPAAARLTVPVKKDDGLIDSDVISAWPLARRRGLRIVDDLNVASATVKVVVQVNRGIGHAARA